VSLECLPGDIPEHIVIDVSELMLNEGVRLRDVVKDVKWRPVSDLDTLLVHVIPIRVAEEPAAEAAPATTPAEPEVAKKGKTDKDEDKA
jgi:large subunit ribosomal protein L25